MADDEQKQADQPGMTMAAAQAEYVASFNRVNTSPMKRRTVSEFAGLQVEECSFRSNNGQRLAGYKYTKAGVVPQGVIIIAHGLGIGGQCVYMDTADYFASHGYLAFAYDATGMDRSEGDSAIGMEQGLIDLNHAIDYVEHDPGLKGYPLALFGHSWGAYCVCTSLNFHPEVKAVVAVSGFNCPADFYRELFGPDNGTYLAYFTGFERTTFGALCDCTALDGFAHTKAGIMVIHSRDDRNVPAAAGYDLYCQSYGDDERFTFREYDDRGHLFIFYTDRARTYDRQFYVSEQSLELSEYGRTHEFDKQIGYELDQSFYGDILTFCRRYIR